MQVPRQWNNSFRILDWRPGDKHNRAAALRLDLAGVRATRTTSCRAPALPSLVVFWAHLGICERAPWSSGSFPSSRRPLSLKTLDMLTSRCSTRLRLPTPPARRASASCTSETESERDRERESARRDCCDPAATWTETGSVLHRWADGVASSASSSSSSDHCGMRKSFIRRSRYSSGSFCANLLSISKNDAAAVSRLQCVKGAYSGCTMSSQNACVQFARLNHGRCHIYFRIVPGKRSAIWPQHEASIRPSARFPKFAWAWCPRSRMTLVDKCILRRLRATLARLASEVGAGAQEETASGDGRGSGSVLWARRQ